MVTSTYPVAKSVCNSVVAAQLKSNPRTSAPFALVLTSIEKVVAVCRPIFSGKEETIESEREILAVENVWRGFSFSTVYHFLSRSTEATTFLCACTAVQMISRRCYARQIIACRKIAFIRPPSSSPMFAWPTSPITTAWVTLRAHQKRLTSFMSSHVSHCYAARVPAQPKSNQLSLSFVVGKLRVWQKHSCIARGCRL